ncbi:MAG: LysR family transcriptional regulator [Bacteroidia bacterium]|nr:LysR family transcriptional regulator [Bacteroidia bacterium]
MNYTLNQLKVFKTITETGSITKAAELLHLTQPAVSIQLKNFQEQFEIPLIEVIGRKVFVTEFGKEVAQSAYRILAEVTEIEQKTLAFREVLVGKLKFSVVSTGKYVMPYFLTSFVNSHPGVTLQMEVTNKNLVLRSLELNEIDFALVSILPNHIKLEKIELLENRLFLVGPAVNAVDLEGKDFSVLEKIPLIFREQGSGTRQVMERFLSNHQINPIKRLELTSNEAVKQAIMAGLGYSIMPLIGIKREFELGLLKIIPISGLPILTNWSLIWLAEKKLSPVARAYIEFLNQNKDIIMKERFQ